MKTTTYLATKDGVTKTVTERPIPTRAEMAMYAAVIRVTAIDYSRHVPLTPGQMLAYGKQALRRGYLAESCQWVDLLCERLLERVC